MIKHIAARLPRSWQHELRRLYFRRQIRTGSFSTDEKEYALLETFLCAGDWVLDIGANVGHYALRMSALVGAAGRVVAFEPVPETFTLLAANARLAPFPNISLLNVAASNRTDVVGVEIPNFADGMVNYYQAHLANVGGGPSVLTLAVDGLSLRRVRLAKIDVEGHELPVLQGMRALLERDHPVLVVETGSDDTLRYLDSLRYGIRRLAGSSNVLCEWKDRTHGVPTAGENADPAPMQSLKGNG